MCTANGIAFGIGSAAQLYGGIKSGEAQQAYHNANADYLTTMNEINQAQAQQAIESVQKVGGMNASQVRNKGISLTKTQKATMASHGLSQSATYQNILDDSITRSERDAMAILYNSDIQAKNIRTNAALQQAQYLSQAAQERAAGRIAYRNGILSSIGQFADSWSKWSQTGGMGYGGKRGGTDSASGAGFGGGYGMAGGGFVPRANTNFYTGVNSIDWNPARFSLVGGAGWRGSGSLWR